MTQEHKISTQDFLLGLGTYQGKTLRNRILAFISEQRPLVSVMGFFIALGGATLSLGAFPSPLKILEIFVAVYLIVSGMHSINDTIDFKRDEEKWPMRPLPSGLISREELGIYGIAIGLAGVALSYIWFTWQCALFVALVLFLGFIYTKYTRDKIGYLTLIWIPAFLPVGAWAAFAPETLFTRLPWLLYLFMMTHQIAHIASVELHAPETKALVIGLEQKNEPALYVLSIILMSIVGIIIYLVASLHWIYLLVLLALTIVSLLSAVPMIKDPNSMENLRKANMAIVNYNIFYWLALAIGVVL